MKRMKAIFVSRKKRLIDEIVSGTVLLATDADKNFLGHVALWFEEVNDEINDRHFKNVIFEAHEPRVGFDTNGNKYDGDQCKYTIEFEVDDDIYERAITIALRLEGRPYGLTTDCIATVIKERMHLNADKLIDCESTMICSEVFAQIIRAMFHEYLKDEDLNMVSPKRVYHTFIDFIGQESRIRLVSSIEG